MAIYIIANASAIGYFLRRGRAEFNCFLHLVVPILGIAAFVPAWLTAAGLPVFSFVTLLAPPISYAGPAVGAWMVLGVAYDVWLYRRHPQCISDVSRVHLDEELAVPDVTTRYTAPAQAGTGAAADETTPSA